ncbi:MAG: TonB-dependent receptor [Proteobacteria bacterium]|nr:TonB-dependent receptor [Pseudomonadota bacterium]
MPAAHRLAIALAAALVAMPAMAQQVDQTAATQSDKKTDKKELGSVTVTGSRIKRTDVEAALPVTIVTKAQIEAQGITSAEQLLQQLNVATNGSDSLASNNSISPPGQADGRGNNGLSGANLRGQGADATLVLLNGRRVAAHGLAGQVVDLNSIPFQAIQRVEVLRDGASAMYGTDAIGGVINFITKTDYQGASLSAGTDITQEGGGNIHHISVLAGVGDLDKDRWNVWFSATIKKNEILRGTQRDFTNSFQPERGLSPDSRGGPFATVVQGGGTLIKTGGLNDPQGGGAQQSVNIANLPGGVGCENAGDMMGPYGYQIWNPAYRYACAWDYGRARTLQQASDTKQAIGRFTFKINDNTQFYIEAMGSEVVSKRHFEALQFTTAIPSTGTTPKNKQDAAGTLDPYPLNAETKATYDMVYNALLNYFGAQANLAAYGTPIAYRWRCYECGAREYTTTTKASRILFGLDGKIGTWDYTAGLSRSTSRAQTVLSGGFVYTAPLKALLASGKLNPFLLPGQSQSPEVLAALQAMSATGVELYHGATTTTAFDATFSGSLGFKLWGSTPVQAAVGTEWRREEYSFGGPPQWDTNIGSPYYVTGGSGWIYQAAGDANFYMSGKARNVKAAYAELLVPVFDSLNVTVSGRYDRYSGFGGTFNPKYSFKWQPVSWLALRGSYSTGFKVADFAKLFRGVVESPTVGSGTDLADPATCPGGNPSNTPGCAQIYPTLLGGGNPNLKPETSSQRSFGAVFAPTSNFNLSVDWWEIKRANTIRSITLGELKDNYAIFANNWIRDSSGQVVQVDQRYVNTGGTLTRGIEVDGNVSGHVFGGRWNVHLNGNYLAQYKTQTLETSPWSSNLVGRFTTWGILPLRWKHTLGLGWAKGNWTHTLTQVYRDGYLDAPASGPGNQPRRIQNGTYIPPEYNPKVGNYITYNYSVSWTGIKNLTATFGVRNLLNTDPPFTLAYLDYGGGSAWEPRVADPRGRSFNLLLEYNFQ